MAHFSSLRHRAALLPAILLVLAAALGPRAAHAQNIGVGTATPDPSAALDVTSASKGALLPRLTQAARLAMGTGGVPAPAVGLLVFQTDGPRPGFYYVASANNWVRLTDATTAANTFIQNQIATDQPASLRISGAAMVGGRLGLGTATPYSQLSNTATNIVGVNGNGGNPGSLAWATSQEGYVGMFFNALDAAAADGLAVKVATLTGVALDVSQGSSQANIGKPLLQVRATGRVGLGTNAPQARLDIAAGADANGSNDPTALAFSYRLGGFSHWLRSRHNGALNTNQNALDFYLNNGATGLASTAPGLISGANPTGAGVGTVHALSLTQDAGSPRVGIGTAAPAHTLDVAGATSTVRLQGLAGTAGRLVTVGADGTLGTTAPVAANSFIENQYAADQAANFRVSGTGRVGGRLVVGAGTAAPRGVLDVRGGDSFLVTDPNSGSAESVLLPGHLFLAPFSGTSGTAYIQARVPNPTATTNIGLQLRTTENGVLRDALYVDPTGSMRIGTVAAPATLVVTGVVQAPAATGYTYDVAKTYTITLGAADFRAENGTTATTYAGTTDELYPNTTAGAIYRAPLRLPQGAIITGITLLAFDAVAANLTSELITYQATGSGGRVVAATSATSGTPGYTTTGVGAAAVTVDNSTTAYSVRLTFGAATVPSGLTMRGVQVRYTVTRVE